MRLVVFSVVVVLLILAAPGSSQNDDITQYLRASPDDTFGYFFQSIGEQIESIFIFDSGRRSDFELKIANRRLAEAVYMREQYSSHEMIPTLLNQHNLAVLRYEKSLEALPLPRKISESARFIDSVNDHKIALTRLCSSPQSYEEACVIKISHSQRVSNPKLVQVRDAQAMIANIIIKK